jgi:hypothetical protein
MAPKRGRKVGEVDDDVSVVRTPTGTVAAEPARRSTRGTPNCSPAQHVSSATLAEVTYATQFNSALSPVVEEEENPAAPLTPESDKPTLPDLLLEFRVNFDGSSMAQVTDVLNQILEDCKSLYSRRPGKKNADICQESRVETSLVSLINHFERCEFYGGKEDYNAQMSLQDFLQCLLYKKILQLHNVDKNKRPDEVVWDLRNQELCICVACFRRGRILNSCVHFRFVGYTHHTKSGLSDSGATRLDRCACTLYEYTNHVTHVGSGQDHPQFRHVEVEPAAGEHFRKFYLNFLPDATAVKFRLGHKSKYEVEETAEGLLSRADPTLTPQFLSEWIRAVIDGKVDTDAEQKTKKVDGVMDA